MNKKKEIFSSFKPQPKGPAKIKEETIKYAEELGKKMVEDKKKARENFMLKLLENARAINKAREDWEDENKDEENKEENK